jgi:hypothetical protein
MAVSKLPAQLHRGSVKGRSSSHAPREYVAHDPRAICVLREDRQHCRPQGLDPPAQFVTPMRFEMEDASEALPPLHVACMVRKHSILNRLPLRRTSGLAGKCQLGGLPACSRGVDHDSVGGNSVSKSTRSYSRQSGARTAGCLLRDHVPTSDDFVHQKSRRNAFKMPTASIFRQTARTEIRIPK